MKNLKNSQEFKFAVVGGFNTALDFSILFGLNFIGLDPVISNIFSTGISFVSSFVLNKKITFKSEHKTRKELLREMIMFTIVTLFGLWVIQSAVIALISPIISSFIDSSSIVLFLAKCIATLFSLTWNFILYKRVVFIDKNKPGI